MPIKERIIEFIERIKAEGKILNNIEQVPQDIRTEVIKVKERWMIEFKIKVKLGDALKILLDDKLCPGVCNHQDCSNILDHPYAKYCSKECRNTCPSRNKIIQEKKRDKMDYASIAKKCRETKTKLGEDGLTIDQRSGRKCSETKRLPENRELASITQKRIKGELSPEVKKEISNKRIKTIQERYGVSHFGGGMSPQKKVTIFGKEFTLQGYEDIAIYLLATKEGIDISDIHKVSSHTSNGIEYQFDGCSHLYFPDLWIESIDTFVEVKSSYWWEREKDRNLAKLTTAEKSVKIKLMIIDKEYSYVDYKQIRREIEESNQGT